MPQLRPSSIDNRRLFSNYYLENRVPKSQAWRDFDKAREALDRIKDIYKKKKHWLTKGSERQLRKELIEPILDVINPYYLVDETIPGGLKPDFIFFNTREAKREKRLPDAIAVGDAKAYGTGFDAPLERQVRSPVRQVYDYFIQSETRWGILTDGALWRLMLKDVRQEYYFEVDLVDILERDNYDSFRYFYFFFRREALSIDSKGRCYLDRVIEGSDRYAQEVGEELKERVYKALLALARGFCNWEANALDASDSDVRERIRENCLILLYRFLFIFYAEDWGFLPSDDPRYQEIGLRSRLTHIKQAMKHGISSIPAEIHSYWDSLRNLFELIDSGNERLGIPPYNGGLFHRTSDGGILGGDDFLDRYTVGNRCLAEAIYLLGTATDPETREETEVDYSSLETMHLGSIYEGLLEFKLAYADEQKVVVKGKGREVWIPLREYKGKTPVQELADYMRVEQGELYMETEKHERKVTGTYYTPDYIVEHIVENTVGQIVDEKLKEAREAGKSRVEAVLATKVCDPAMGSGHFLVEATEFLAQKLLDALEEEVAEGFREAEEFSPQWAKREVIGHCIYGVDLNPLAVELSKVSLWLATISRDKPLSFLDHRLKCGNSLIGAELIDLPWYPEQEKKKETEKEARKVDLSGHKPFIDKLLESAKELEAIKDETLKQIKEKERIFNELKGTLEYEKIKTLADLSTSIYFGNQIAGGDKYKSRMSYGDFTNHVYYGGKEEWEENRNRSWVKNAQRIADQMRFFHWELQFPEVFYSDERKDNPGFDAVVGNPPWGGEVIPIKNYLMRKYVTKRGELDYHIFFSEKELRLLRLGGGLGTITPNTWFYVGHASSLRRFVLHNSSLDSITELEKGIFVDAPDIVPAIWIAKRTDGVAPKEVRIQLLKFGIGIGRLTDLGERRFRSAHQVNTARWLELPDYIFNLRLTDDVVRLLQKLETNSILLAEISEVSYGIKTGNNKRYLADYPRAENYRPSLVSGTEIGRYHISWKGMYLDYGEYLAGYRDQSLEVPKIVVQYIRKLSLNRRLIAALDDESKFYPLNNFSILTKSPSTRYKLAYVLALVNSLALNQYFANNFIDYNIKPTYLKRLPLRRISFTTPKEERERLLNESKQKYQGERFEEILESVEECLPRDREGNSLTEKERSDVVHDLLAFLADQMIEMSKEIQNQTELFFTDLEGIVDEKIFKTLGKGKQGRSLYKKESCSVYVEKNLYSTYHLNVALTWSREAFKDLVRLLVKKVPNLSDIMSVYDRYHPEFKTLQERIERTDELIDQIVYRLCGLTDEEIRIVEGSL